MLTSYTYQGMNGFYERGEALYFTNLELEVDHESLSDIEPVRSVCQARHKFLRENIPEIICTLWAPYVILKANVRASLS